MELFLTVLSGIGWILVYEECIRIGIKQKTYAMPLFALGLNFSWEFLYSVVDIVYEAHGPLVGMNLVQEIVNIFWCCLDVVILYTYLKNGKKEWPGIIGAKYFIPWTLLVLVCSFALQIVFIVEFGFTMASQYSAFLQNVVMSILFIQLFVKRNGDFGQSLLLAVAKWIGTLAPTIFMGVINYNPVVLVCGIFCTVFDVIYIVLLFNERKKKRLTVR
ncbi:hypothetical protein [Frisingicoccus sp.]|uniref:transmembrane-type terpene cyclase n=1 Tax=Frisingicoccus sp. TaxID=1918627 RepID=UPI00399A92B1